jgi:uncharacterized protein (DUF736 family)
MGLRDVPAQAKGVRIVAETNRSNENAPSYRIYVGRADYA